MANRLPGVSEKLLEAAKAEFLCKGYEDASLREIAKAAETSTNSIYVRFQDKASFFFAIVTPAMERLNSIFESALSEFESEHLTADFEEMQQYSANRLNDLVDILYDDYDTYKLLACCGPKNMFSDWVNSLAELESEYTLRYIKATEGDQISSGRLMPELLHMLSSAYWSGVLEVLYHDMPRETARDYVAEVELFFANGYRSIFNP